MTLNQVEKVVSVLQPNVPSYVSIFAGRIADTGTDPVPMMAEAVKLLKSLPASELIWASPRELLNIFQADSIGCQIITVTNDILKKLGIDYAIDEYNNPSSQSTGGHFHGQLNRVKAYDGGVFEPVPGGVTVNLAEAGQREAVVPLPDPASRIKIETPKKEPLSSVMNNSTTQTNTMQGTNTDQLLFFNEMMEMMEEKFDAMLDALEAGNSTADKLLKSSRV
jgi:hypothetical protein